MNRSLLAIATVAVAASGCLNPQTTTLPEPYAKDPNREIRSYERFDPFSLGDMGPETYTRQRDFAQPRTAPTRAKTGAVAPQLVAPAQTIPGQSFPGQTAPGTPYFMPAQPGTTAPGFSPPVQPPYSSPGSTFQYP